MVTFIMHGSRTTNGQMAGDETMQPLTAVFIISLSLLTRDLDARTAVIDLDKKKMAAFHSANIENAVGPAVA